MSTFTKLGLLLRLLPHRPVEFCDRLATVLEKPWERIFTEPGQHNKLSPQEAIVLMEETLHANLSDYLLEPSFKAIESHITDGIDRMRGNQPFAPSHSADLSLAAVCYVVTRALKPSVVLETGVAYGVTSSFLLQGLEANQNGNLWSIDLPPLVVEADQFVGALIPHHLRNRWHLCRGVSKRLLTTLLPRLGQVDLFVHDSLHFYRNMMLEFETVWPFIPPGGILLSDDVGDNRAFQEFFSRVNTSLVIVSQEKSKDSCFGIVVKGR